MSSSPASGRPYFFLSYAHTPKHDQNDRNDPDRWVHKFFGDVCQNILDITNAHPAEVGFIDRNNRAGGIWPVELARALATCRVFVPLYSERYFGSEHCGKEWFAFSRRELNQRARLPSTGSAILPALWSRVKPDLLPDVTKDLQYVHPNFGGTYADEGFYGIIKLDRFGREYRRLAYRFAQLIVEVAEETQLEPAEPAKYSLLQSSFGSPDQTPGAAPGMQITLLALDTSTALPAGRSGDYYGRTSRAWRPYHPDYSQPLADYATALAERCGCMPVVGSYDEHHRVWMANGHPIPPGLCLIDPWAAISARHLEQLRHLDELESWVSVLVPWNQHDAELAAAEQVLRQALRQSLGRKMDSVPHGCQLAVDGIPSLPEFGELMPEMAMTMLRRFRRDPNVRAYPPGPPTERFRLRGVQPEDPGGSQ